ncbi:hypothetical protein ABEQ02_12330, partial [Cutibacterium acnes]
RDEGTAVKAGLVGGVVNRGDQARLVGCDEFGREVAADVSEVRLGLLADGRGAQGATGRNAVERFREVEEGCFAGLEVRRGGVEGERGGGLCFAPVTGGGSAVASLHSELLLVSIGVVGIILVGGLARVVILGLVGVVGIIGAVLLTVGPFGLFGIVGTTLVAIIRERGSSGGG